MSSFLAGALVVWFVLVGLSVVFVVVDLITNSPLEWVMKVAWVLIIIYTGPVGLFMYFMTSRQPLPGAFGPYVAKLWKQAFGSEIHCVAGDATGVIIMAITTYLLGAAAVGDVRFFANLPEGWAVALEYTAAFIVGLFIFQALFMLPMYGGNYWLSVRKTFYAEFTSMNMVMVGMIPVMVIGRNKLEGGNDPLNPLFWAIYGMAAIAGFITAYAVNWWLVSNGLKHGIMAKDADPSEELARTHSGALAEVAATSEAGGDSTGTDEPMGDMDDMGLGGGVSMRRRMLVLAITMAFLAASWFGTSTVVPLTF